MKTRSGRKKIVLEGPYVDIRMPKGFPFPYGVIKADGEFRLVALFEDQYPADEYVRLMNNKIRRRRR